MKYSAQEEYGLRCMIALAKEGTEGSLTIPVIAKSEGLTQSHVAKLLAVLRKSGFITSHRGQLGGYTLAKPAAEIAVGDLLASLGGRLTRDNFCDRFTGLKEECVHLEGCSMHPLWTRIQDAVDRAVSGIMLSDLVETEAGVNVRLYDDPRARAKSGA